MKYLIVGLGNIGPEYENTRHNIGFRVLDALAKASKLVHYRQKVWRNLRIKNQRTHINLVKAVYVYEFQRKCRTLLAAKRKHSGSKDLLVIVDDLALPFGSLRLKPRGSDAGHNGLKHIQQILGSDNYAQDLDSESGMIFLKDNKSTTY